MHDEENDIMQEIATLINSFGHSRAHVSELFCHGRPVNVAATFGLPPGQAFRAQQGWGNGRNREPA